MFLLVSCSIHRMNFTYNIIYIYFSIYKYMTKIPIYNKNKLFFLCISCSLFRKITSLLDTHNNKYDLSITDYSIAWTKTNSFHSFLSWKLTSDFLVNTWTYSSHLNYGKNSANHVHVDLVAFKHLLSYCHVLVDDQFQAVFCYGSGSICLYMCPYNALLIYRYRKEFWCYLCSMRSHCVESTVCRNHPPLHLNRPGPNTKHSVSNVDLRYLVINYGQQSIDRPGYWVAE